MDLVRFFLNLFFSIGDDGQETPCTGFVSVKIGACLFNLKEYASGFTLRRILLCQKNKPLISFCKLVMYALE